jgi:hypothetical protein
MSFIKDIMYLLALIFKGVFFVLSYLLRFIGWYFKNCFVVLKSIKGYKSEKLKIKEEII